MDNKYFPHSKDGDINKLGMNTVAFNFVPNAAISLDPRSVITEWTPESIASLGKKDIYAGMQIYCLADKTTRICRWVPESNLNYTGINCIWDVVYSDEDATEWIDVKSSSWTPTDPEDAIKNAESLTWCLLPTITTQQLYIGFVDTNNIEDDYTRNNIIKNVIANNNIIKYTTYRTVNNPVAKAVTVPASSKGNYVSVVVPKIGRNIDVNAITLNGSNMTLNKISKNYEIMSGSMTPTDFDIYVTNETIPTSGTVSLSMTATSLGNI